MSMGLVPRVLLTWRSPARALRGIVGLSEPALLALLLGTLGLYFVAQWPGHARAAALDPSVPLQARLGGALLATMFLMPLIVLALAALVALVLRAAGRRIAGRDSRLALVWAMAAAVPAVLLCGLVQGVNGPGAALNVLQAGTFAAFLWFWFRGLALLSGPLHPVKAT